MDSKIQPIDFDLEAIEDGRRQTFEQKFWAGAELFDYACSITKAGIRQMHPEFDEDQVLDELRRRIRMGEELDEMLWK